MGNSNSGQAVVTHSPPPWTQSLPRDTNRYKKYGAVPGTKVLPERIPGQRLKATQNGRNLQEQGTISPRKITDLHLNNSITSNNHMINPLQNSLSNPAYPYIIHSNQNKSNPSKSFTSEPDLRGSSPSSHMSLPIQNKNCQKTISESPIKEKIKSKKRYKAPVPPQYVGPPLSLPFERSDYMPHKQQLNETNSTTSSPAKPPSEKSKKRGLFRKKCDSRMSNYDDDNSVSGSNCKEPKEGKFRYLDRSTTPVLLASKSKSEIREKAKSLDNLQYELQNSSQELRTSLTSLEMIEQVHHSRKSSGKERQSGDSHNYHKKTLVNELNQSIDMKNKLDTKHESEKNKINNISREEITLYKYSSHERTVKDILSSPVGDPKRLEVLKNRPTFEYHRSSSSCSSHRDNDEPKDEWDIAEEEWLEKKRKGEELQNEIENATKNLRKTSFSTKPSDKTDKYLDNRRLNSNEEITPVSDECTPKSFFFGMEPSRISKDNTPHQKTALSKLKEETEHSRHSTIISEKQHSLNKDRNLKSENRQYEDESGDRSEVIQNKIKISQRLDDFSTKIERDKHLNKLDEFSSSITRRSDGGYHSRQNSGSFHLDTETTSDEDNQIKMNLRPILPRRQLELPRFSPNAAWRLLSTETSGLQKESRNDAPLNGDLMNINEDHIYRYTRPIAPLRLSNEKSADSGISGDAGSPGPLQEFDSMHQDKSKTSFGPLAVSSPVASGRVESKRTWTPAQDLDENSIEENMETSGKNAIYEISTVPKLTSRSNMFTNTYSLSSAHEFENSFFKDKLNSSASHLPGKYAEDFIENPDNSFQDNHSDVDDEKENFISPDSWRENWSLSRSTPNSLNYDEANVDVDRNKMKKSKQGQGVCEGSSAMNSLELSSHGHIMYLPEYKSYHMGHSDLNDHKNSFAHRESNNYSQENALIKSCKDQQGNVNNKKTKKFTYQSTVRVLEKKKLEEKLSREVQEKEKKRLKEVESMFKVEEKFQKKREREKRRLKKQLSEIQHHNTPENSSQMDVTDRKPSDNSYGMRYDMVADNEAPYFSSPDNNNQRRTPPYHSLPPELINNSSSDYESSQNHLSSQKGKISGLKNWVRGRRDSRCSYNSDASSTTMTSSARRDQDCVPISSRSTKKQGNIRQEIICASKQRNADLFYEKESRPTDSSSPAPSAISKDSRIRTSTPNSKRTVSPDSRRSSSIDVCHRTKELPEMRQERRQYREYRQSERSSFLGFGRNNQKNSSANHNYRRDFCVGNVARPSSNSGYPKEGDRCSKDGRKVKDIRSRRFHSTEFLDSESEPGSHGRRPHILEPLSPVHPSSRTPFNHSRSYSEKHISSAYQNSHLTPFKPSKGFQPVQFRPQPANVVTVT